MLTTVRAYSSWQNVPTLLLDDDGRAETDLIQVRNIVGLEPVKGAVNTSPLGSVDGSAYTGTSIPYRNIILSIVPNPDWNVWHIETLRRVVYDYFMPKLLVRLVFESDDIPPVEIFGYVESCEPNLFSSDGQIDVSIICPDPYFTAVSPIIKTGAVATDATHPIEIEYDGNIECGINVEVTGILTTNPSTISIQSGDPLMSSFKVSASVNNNMYFVMNSIPGNKYVQNVGIGSGLITNLLSKIVPGSQWPLLQPGINDFVVYTDSGGQDWQLIYFPRYGGL